MIIGTHQAKLQSIVSKITMGNQILGFSKRVSDGYNFVLVFYISLLANVDSCVFGTLRNFRKYVCQLMSLFERAFICVAILFIFPQISARTVIFTPFPLDFLNVRTLPYISKIGSNFLWLSLDDRWVLLRIEFICTLKILNFKNKFSLQYAAKFSVPKMTNFQAGTITCYTPHNPS